MIHLKTIDFLLLVPAYTYILYPCALIALRPRRVRSHANSPKIPHLKLTIVVPVHNGVRMVASRILNLLETDYPKNLIDILLVDDGSVDGTSSAVPSGITGVRVLRVERQRGRAHAHLLGRSEAGGDILVFTDVDTSFAPGTLRALADAFDDPKVSCASGVIHWQEGAGSAIANSMGLYWRFEMWLRHLESERGVMTVASGACMAVRAAAFPMLRLTEDIDCVAPLEISLAGNYTVQVEEAKAWDRTSETVGGELRGRIRMVALDAPALLRRLTLRACMSTPVVVWSSASHKLARWLTAPCLFLHGGLSLAAVNDRRELFAFYLVLALAIALGAAANIATFRVPIASQLYTLFIAHVGFLLGILRGIFGPKIEGYSPAEQEPV